MTDPALLFRAECGLEPEEQVARHEAGHAVAALRLPWELWEIDQVTIEPPADSKLRGFVSYVGGRERDASDDARHAEIAPDRMVRDPVDDEDHAFIAAFGVVFYAGAAAQFPRCDGFLDERADWGSRNDRLDMTERLARCGLYWPADVWHLPALDLTCEFLDDVWGEVLSVAAALRERRTLTGAEVRGIVAGAPRMSNRLLPRPRRDFDEEKAAEVAAVLHGAMVTRALERQPAKRADILPGSDSAPMALLVRAAVLSQGAGAHYADPVEHFRRCSREEQEQRAFAARMEEMTMANQTTIEKTLSEARAALDEQTALLAGRERLVAAVEKARAKAKEQRAEFVTATLDSELGDEAAGARAATLRADATRGDLEAETLDQAAHEFDETRVPAVHEKVREIRDQLVQASEEYVRGEAERIAEALERVRVEAVRPLLIRAHALAKASASSAVAHALGRFGGLADDQATMDRLAAGDGAAKALAAPVVDAESLRRRAQELAETTEPAWREKIRRDAQQARGAA